PPPRAPAPRARGRPGRRAPAGPGPSAPHGDRAHVVGMVGGAGLPDPGRPRRPPAARAPDRQALTATAGREPGRHPERPTSRTIRPRLRGRTDGTATAARRTGGTAGAAARDHGGRGAR